MNLKSLLSREAACLLGGGMNPGFFFPEKIVELLHQKKKKQKITTLDIMDVYKFKSSNKYIHTVYK